ncbi:MarR family winged helix-turn-helix transcriptional regulator [Salisaeta longa]|uniref:MarR family winged helix-turn-helix transcriptional regulator n=1 Tax=Salisaeta longa TaxID=503170 RepID=UPI0003B474B8|nr:MarR family transcriptional regulator [Salisaeta longa]
MDLAPGSMGTTLKDHIQQEAPFESDAHEALLNLFVAAGVSRRRIERVCRSYDLQFSHYNILRILRGVHPQGHARCDISERMVDPSPDVTRLIDKLVDRGLVRRSQSEADRRMTIHTITDEGLALLDEMHPDIQAVQEWFAARVSPRDLRHLSRICEGIYTDYTEDL